MVEARHVAVPLDRLSRWLAGFEQRNGALSELEVTTDAALLRTERSGWARVPLRRPLADVPPVDSASLVGAIVDAASGQDRSLAVILLRRGGYSIASAQTTGVDVRVTASKTDQKYVQGRTAAGGQSQQRFARRRAGQAAALVRSATDTAVRVLDGRYDAIVTGGDLPLIEEMLSDRRLATLAGLPRTHVEVGEPRRRTIDEAIAAARSVTIEVANATE